VDAKHGIEHIDAAALLLHLGLGTELDVQSRRRHRPVSHCSCVVGRHDYS
jgi:hypothetical protein